MSYQFNPTKPAADEVRRVAEYQISLVLKSLSKVGKDVNTSVHDARKELKKLRALIRMVRVPLGKKVYNRENEAVRDAGRVLSSFRDAWVKYSLIKGRLDKQDDFLSRDALKPAADRLYEIYQKTVNEDDVTKAVDKAKSILKESKKRIKDWPLENGGEDEANGFELFREGLIKVYDRGASDLSICLANPTANNLHDWRKRCKYLRYQLELLHPAFPKLLLATEDALHDLTNYLGDDHDLAVVRASLEKGLDQFPLSDEQLQVINSELEDEHRRLIDPCWPLGQKVFAEEPAQFVQRIEAYWTAAVMAG